MVMEGTVLKEVMDIYWGQEEIVVLELLQKLFIMIVHELAIAGMIMGMEMVFIPILAQKADKY